MVWTGASGVDVHTPTVWPGALSATGVFEPDDDRMRGNHVDLIWQDGDGRDVEENDCTLPRAVELMSRMNGGDHSLVIVVDGNGSMSIGGDAEGPMTVSYTHDDYHFFELESEKSPSRADPVWVVNGGQGSDVEAGVVVDLGLAKRAATWWFTGAADEKLRWRESQAGRGQRLFRHLAFFRARDRMHAIVDESERQAPGVPRTSRKGFEVKTVRTYCSLLDTNGHSVALGVEEALQLLRRVEGNECSSLSFRISEVSDLSIGGGSGDYVVTYTPEENEFLELQTGRPVAQGQTTRLTAAGQPADFDSRIVVSLGECESAVRALFAEELDSLPWRPVQQMWSLFDS